MGALLSLAVSTRWNNPVSMLEFTLKSGVLGTWRDSSLVFPRKKIIADEMNDVSTSVVETNSNKDKLK